jgi:hypothetical protein
MEDRLDIYQKVKIIGPSIYGGGEHKGEEFEITDIRSNGEQKLEYSRINLSWYPASSLQLVKDLKVGDWIEIIKPGIPDYTGKIERIIRIDEPDHYNYPNQIEDKSWWSSKSLRKLTPSEIAKHVQPCTKEDGCGYVAKCDWCYKDLGQCAVGGNGEHYCSISCSVMAEDHKKLAAIEKRLAILEGEQPETRNCNLPEGRISITIQRGEDEVHGISNSACPAECLEWCKAVLGNMKKM